MALDITGKIVQVMGETSGQSKTGNTWVKQEFVIETYDKFPRKVMMSTMGDKVQELKRFKSGDEVKVSFNLESREYNGRWYTDVRAWRIEGSTEQTQSSGPAYTGGGNSEYNQEPQTSFTPDTTTDDLPF